MNVLTICSALNNSYLGIEFEGKIYTEIIKSNENYHSLYLISKIKNFFEENNLDFNKLDLIGVNTGPGSFTGIRVALSIAKTIASELNLPLVSLTTNEILLNAFDCDILLMDARRDMFFVGDREKIELIFKNNVQEKLNNKKILSDKRSAETFKSSICYEDETKDLAKVMLILTKEKFVNSTHKECFNYLKTEANYIQTPPIF